MVGTPEDWLAQADEDLRTAEYNLEGEMLDAAAFYAQQAAEKALKAVHLGSEGRLTRTHDLVALGRRVDAPEDLLERCKILSPAYFYTRYPDVAGIDAIDEDVPELVEHAKEVVSWARSRT